MSEILFYSIARAGGVTLPPGITDPSSPDYRPLYPRRKKRSPGRLERLRRFAGRRLLDLGLMAQRLGWRWANPAADAASFPQLTPVK